MINEDGRVEGVRISSKNTDQKEILAEAIIIATGGYISDQGKDSLMK